MAEAPVAETPVPTLTEQTQPVETPANQPALDAQTAPAATQEAAAPTSEGTPPAKDAEASPTSPPPPSEEPAAPSQPRTLADISKDIQEKKKLSAEDWQQVNDHNARVAELVELRVQQAQAIQQVWDNLPTVLAAIDEKFAVEDMSSPIVQEAYQQARANALATERAKVAPHFRQEAISALGQRFIKLAGDTPDNRQWFNEQIAERNYEGMADAIEQAAAERVRLEELAPLKKELETLKLSKAASDKAGTPPITGSVSTGEGSPADNGALTPERYKSVLSSGKEPSAAEIDAMTARYAAGQV